MRSKRACLAGSLKAGLLIAGLALFNCDVEQGRAGARERRGGGGEERESGETGRAAAEGAEIVAAVAAAAMSAAHIASESLSESASDPRPVAQEPATAGEGRAPRRRILSVRAWPGARPVAAVTRSSV